MRASGDTVWIGDVNHNRMTSLAALPLSADSFSYLGARPEEYHASRQVMLSHPYATSVPTGNGETLVGLTGSPALLRLRPDGQVRDRIVIPAVRRRGVPADIVERFKQPLESSEIASMVSAPVGMQRLSSGDIAMLYEDINYNEGSRTADGYLSILSPDLERVCADLPLHYAQESRPATGFRGDTLFVVEQHITSSARAESYLKKYPLSSRGCRWIGTEQAG